jgi:hypothetical protein
LASKIQVRYVPLLSFFLEKDPEEKLESLKRLHQVLENERSAKGEEDSSRIPNEEKIEDSL